MIRRAWRWLWKRPPLPVLRDSRSCVGFHALETLDRLAEGAEIVRCDHLADEPRAYVVSWRDSRGPSYVRMVEYHDPAVPYVETVTLDPHPHAGKPTPRTLHWADVLQAKQHERLLLSLRRGKPPRDIVRVESNAGNFTEFGSARYADSNDR